MKYEKTIPQAVKANCLVQRLYEEAKDEPESLYWQAANKLEMALDRIHDLLMPEDGYAHKEARKFLEQFDQ